MELNKLKDGADWMTAEEKALCREFVNGMRNKVFRSRGVIETPLLTMRMNATISTYLHVRRLEAHLIGSATIEKEQSKPDGQENEQTQAPTADRTVHHGKEQTNASDQAPDQQPSDGPRRHRPTGTACAPRANAPKGQNQKALQSNVAGDGTADPTPNTDPHSRSQVISLLESIGKAWERNGRSIRDLEASCAKAGTPITLGLADEMKPIILKATGVIEESILAQKRLSEAEAANEPAQFEPESG